MQYLGWLAASAAILSFTELERAGRRATLPRVSAGEDSAESCVVPGKHGETRVRVTNATRRACVTIAQLLVPDVPDISHEDLRAGPPSKMPFGADADVYCRLKPREEQGGSLKFRCLRTDAKNQLYDNDGTLVPAAASFDADDNLLDRLGNKVLDEDGQALEGDELRVKYFMGSYPAGRYREMFTETVVSHVFWMMGVPADRVYMPASVQCFGCNPHPFGQTALVSQEAPQTFTLASVERPIEGKTIAVRRGSGFLRLGGKYDHGFSFDELNELVSRPPESRRVEVEAHAIALNIVGYNNTHAYQNDLVCRRGKWDKQTGECEEVVAFVADLGGTLGGAKAVAGDDGYVPDMKKHPRGEFLTFSQGAVFRDPASCTLHYPIGRVHRVSEAARAMIDTRIRGRLDREHFRIIFEKARIHRMEKILVDRVAAERKLAPGPTLDRAVQHQWADEMQKRMDEILNARCPA
ncbi:MAG: hypothetical protein ABIZ91_18935 [Gemmatimonadaceae bacterium]